MADLSKAEKFAHASAVERAEFLATMGPNGLANLEFDWEFWGRPKQFAPAGRDWDNWLILAGRGFGKTRTGAEWVRNNMCGDTPMTGGKWRHIALIAETAADARDVIVGDGKRTSDPTAGSGLLQVHPKGFRPIYEPSKRRLTWPNGAIASIYNGTEPDQLRGPQHDAAWCLIASTPVLMADGSQKKIADVRANDLVMTRSGARAVLAQALTKLNAQVYRVRVADGRCITGTPNHPVYIDGIGFVPIGDLKIGMSACVTTALNGAVELGTGKLTGTTKQRLGYIGKSLPMLMAQSSLATTFTTRTKTSRITASIISNCLRTANIALSTSKLSLVHTAKRLCKTLSLVVGGTQKLDCFAAFSALSASLFFIAHRQIRPAFAQVRASRLPEAARFQASGVYASIAATLTPLRLAYSGTAAKSATTTLAKLARPIIVQSNALVAITNSAASGQTRDSAESPAPCITTAEIVSVEKLQMPQHVYDLSVEGTREFIANGIVVHNCDELAKWRYAQEAWDQLQFGMRTGDNPQACITTTPRPIMLLKEIIKDKGTAITGGSTFDNASNLSPKFLSLIKRKYEGSRLGRQELDAELLEDMEGALWKRSIIDALRVRLQDVPPLVRVVVAIDPNASSNDDSNECGIVCAGIGEDGHAYVLDDASAVLAPSEWATEAVALYRDRRADLIVAEINNGGEMVENTIRMVDSNVPYRSVWASRGKVTRAEPISALYEQGRVHHVGAFARMEDQMCAFTVDFNRKEMGYSPDRLDALVWALTELMVDGGERRLLIA